MDRRISVTKFVLQVIRVWKAHDTRTCNNTMFIPAVIGPSTGHDIYVVPPSGNLVFRPKAIEALAKNLSLPFASPEFFVGLQSVTTLPGCKLYTQADLYRSPRNENVHSQ